MILHTPRGKLVLSYFWTPWKRWLQWGGRQTPSHLYGWLGPATFAYRKGTPRGMGALERTLIAIPLLIGWCILAAMFVWALPLGHTASLATSGILGGIGGGIATLWIGVSVGYRLKIR
jgi:hypothetical protein